jgi:protein unc-13
MQWLNENDDVSLEYLHGAFNRDKKDGVKNYILYYESIRIILTQLSKFHSFKKVQSIRCFPILLSMCLHN